MKKLSYHTVLAFIFTSQALSMMGCAQHIKVFECKAKCADTTLECRTAVDTNELNIP